MLMPTGALVAQESDRGSGDGDSGASSESKISGEAHREAVRQVARDFRAASASDKLSGPDDASTPVEVWVRVDTSDETSATEVLRHEFESLDAFGQCLRDGFDGSLDKPERAGACEVPDALAEVLLGYRGASPVDVASCEGACCKLEEGPPARLGLKLEEVCVSESDAGTAVIERLTLRQTPETADDPRIAMRQRALRFAWEFRHADNPWVLSPYLTANEPVRVEMEVSRNVQDDMKMTEAFQSRDELLACLKNRAAVDPGNRCRAVPERFREYVGANRYADLDVKPCSDRCCAIESRGALHQTLFVRKVCFDEETVESKEGSVPRIDRLYLWWSW